MEKTVKATRILRTWTQFEDGTWEVVRTSRLAYSMFICKPCILITLLFFFVFSINRLISRHRLVLTYLQELLHISRLTVCHYNTRHMIRRRMCNQNRRNKFTFIMCAASYLFRRARNSLTASATCGGILPTSIPSVRTPSWT